MTYAAILGVAGTVALVTEVAAHDHWIARERLTDPVTNEWCCGAEDCRPEPVTVTPQGYRTQNGDVVPSARVIWRAPDGQWWRCHKPSGETRCLIGPPPGA